jgi:hypothetical protein
MDAEVGADRNHGGADRGAGSQLGWVGCARSEDGSVMVDWESGELRARRLSGCTSEVVEFCAGLPGPTRVAYEAGPTGFTLARALEDADIECVVAALGKIERPAQGYGEDRPA